MSEDQPLTPEKKRYLFGGKIGRQEGVKNKSTLAALEAARVARENPGELPMDFLLRVMRDETEDMDRRITCATVAFSGLHPRLAAVKVEAPPVINVDRSPEELYARIVELLIRSGAVNPKYLNKTRQGILPAPTVVVDGELDD